MAGEPKPGESKIYQLIVLLITTIVAPVSVYVLTHSIDLKPSSSIATQPATAVLAAEMPAQTSAPTLAQSATTEVTLTETALTTVTATGVTSPTLTPTVPTATNTALPSPTPAGTMNPQGLIPAGSIVVANDYSLGVESTDIRLENDTIALNFHIRNLSSKIQTFVYAAQAITVKDDTGRVYEVLFGEKKDTCRKQDLQILKKVELKPNQEVTIHSVTTKEMGKWCSRDSNQLVPLYAGPVNDNVKSLFVMFSGFGPFTGFSYEIKR